MHTIQRWDYTGLTDCFALHPVGSCPQFDNTKIIHSLSETVTPISYRVVVFTLCAVLLCPPAPSTSPYPLQKGEFFSSIHEAKCYAQAQSPFEGGRGMSTRPLQKSRANPHKKKGIAAVPTPAIPQKKSTHKTCGSDPGAGYRPHHKYYLIDWWDYTGFTS